MGNVFEDFVDGAIKEVLLDNDKNTGQEHLIISTVMRIYSIKHSKYKRTMRYCVRCNVKINDKVIKIDHDLNIHKASKGKNVTQSWYGMKVPDW